MYTPCPFDEKEQIRLKNFVGKLDVNSTKFAVSNSDTPFIRDLYKGYNIKEIKTRYKIGRHRPIKTELLITNTRRVPRKTAKVRLQQRARNILD